MYESRCFRASAGAGQLEFVSCHDPHEPVPPAQRVAHFRERCLRCHERHGCGLAVAERLRCSPQDSCVDCHMPRYGSADIPHTASTDHRILRGGARGEKPAGPAPHADHPLESFYAGGGGADAERDRAVALVNWVVEGRGAAEDIRGDVLAALETATRRHADDFPAGEAFGYALALRRQTAQALAAFRSVFARAPDRERVLLGAAAAAEELGETEAALDYWRRAVAANPWASGYRRNLALLLSKRQACPEAEAACRAWLRLDPMSVEACVMFLRCLLALGNRDEARTVFAQLEALTQPNLAELRIRFEKKLR
jgi:hypothetical protein